MVTTSNRVVVLSPDQARLVDAAVAAGVVGSAEEAVAEALALWTADAADARPETTAFLRRVHREGLESGPSEPFDTARYLSEVSRTSSLG